MKQTGKVKVSGIFTLTNHRVNSRIFKMTSEEQIENLLHQADKLGQRKELIEKVHLYHLENPKKGKLYYYEKFVSEMKIKQKLD